MEYNILESSASGDDLLEDVKITLEEIAKTRGNIPELKLILVVIDMAKKAYNDKILALSNLKS